MSYASDHHMPDLTETDAHDAITQRTISFWLWYDVTASNRDARSSCQGRGSNFLLMYLLGSARTFVYTYRPITSSLNTNTV